LAAIVLGYVAAAHGLKGEVRVKLFHAESEALTPGASVTLMREGNGQTLVVDRAVRHGDHVRVAFAGIDSRDAAEVLVRSEVSVDRSALPELGDDEVYLADLVGLKAAEGDQVVGTIEEVLHHPASDCARIREIDGVREVPLHEPYLVEIDLREGVVRFAHLEDFEKTGVAATPETTPER